MKINQILYLLAIIVIVSAALTLGEDLEVVHILLFISGLLFFGRKLYKTYETRK